MLFKSFILVAFLSLFVGTVCAENRYGKALLTGTCLARYQSAEIGTLPKRCGFSTRGRRARSFLLERNESDQSYDLLGEQGRVRKSGQPYAIYSGSLKRSDRKAVALLTPEKIRIWFVDREKPAQIEWRKGKSAIAAEHLVAGSVRLSCGHTAAQALLPAVAAQTAQLPLFSPPLDLEIALTGDKEFAAEHGAGASSYLDGVVSAVDSIYMQDLGVRLVRTNTTILNSTSGLTSNKANGSGELLDQFTLVYGPTDPSPRDVSHLVTGKNLSGAVIGLAWLGVVCAAPDFSYSLSEDLNSTLEPLIMAHELGHNLGADHDTKLMAPALDPSNNSFSAFSIGEISSHINSFGSCLGVSSVSSLAVSAKFKKVSDTKERLNISVTPDTNNNCAGAAGRILVYGAANQASLQSDVVQAEGIFLTSFPDLTAGIKQSKKVEVALTTEPLTTYFAAFLECEGALTATTKNFSAKTRSGGKVGSSKKILKKAASKYAALDVQ